MPVTMLSVLVLVLSDGQRGRPRTRTASCAHIRNVRVYAPARTREPRAVGVSRTSRRRPFSFQFISLFPELTAYPRDGASRLVAGGLADRVQGSIRWNARTRAREGLVSHGRVGRCSSSQPS
ncbi:hypothetical protein GY45DRAFT_207913 [Cubamyces sp. BRFM 1775]|nr:hypothetical protein GY45DRAFT_207913 [Cubamyces sp. BRFM 1775]